MTDAQRAALVWLLEHGGDGVFTRGGVLLAQGERAHFAPLTWRQTTEAGATERHGPKSKRLRLTDSGAAQARRWQHDRGVRRTLESRGADDDEE